MCPYGRDKIQIFFFMAILSTHKATIPGVSVKIPNELLARYLSVEHSVALVTVIVVS